MDFTFSSEQELVRNTFARFSDEQIAPQAAALDEAHQFPMELFRKLGELGFFAMRYPEEVGGVDADLQTFCLGLTEISRGSLSVAGCAAMQSLMGTKFLQMLANDEIQERLLKPALRVKNRSICMTEPNAAVIWVRLLQLLKKQITVIYSMVKKRG